MAQRSIAWAVIVATVLLASSAQAQNPIGQIQNRANQADKLVVSDQDEITIGTNVSLNLRRRFGVFQDEPTHRYVTLVGQSLLGAAERKSLPWEFIVLDTDGVNAFAAPGGFIHVTRGLLGMVRNEAELAGVLAHEIGHVEGRHIVEEVRRAAAIDIGQQEFLNGGGLVTYFARKAYDSVIENKFERNDEMDADARAIRLTQSTAYSPRALARFLERLRERNKDITDPKFRNGLFASHPEMNDRILKIDEISKALTAKALVEPRFMASVKLSFTELAGISVVDKEPEPVDPQQRGGGGLLDRVKRLPGQIRARPTTTSASAATRGVERDRYAKGGGNERPVALKPPVFKEDVEAFKKGIV